MKMQPTNNGVEEVNNEKVCWTYYFDSKNKQGQLRALYEDKWLIEDDNSFGLEHALGLLHLDVKNRQSNKKP